MADDAFSSAAQQSVLQPSIAVGRDDDKVRGQAPDKVIRTHPYESIGVAFGIGLLVGVLVTRK